MDARGGVSLRPPLAGALDHRPHSALPAAADNLFITTEATASSDPFTEAQVQAGLNAVLRGRTSVVIAHRLSTVRATDRIILMRQGRIIESGDHEALLEQGGHCADLYTTYFRHQALSYQPWDEPAASSR